MATQTQSKNDTSSPHLGPARELLSKLDEMTSSPDADAQVQATAAVAHSVLVLAEQVAAVRVIMAADVVRSRNGGGNGTSDN